MCVGIALHHQRNVKCHKDHESGHILSTDIFFFHFRITYNVHTRTGWVTPYCFSSAYDDICGRHDPLHRNILGTVLCINITFIVSHCGTEHF